MHVYEEVKQYDPQTGTHHVISSEEHVITPREEQAIVSERITRVVWYIAGLVNLLLLVRFVLLLLGARAVGFATFMYHLTDPLVAPFRGIFPAMSAAGSYFDSAAILGIIVYTLVAWLITSLVNITTRPTTA